MDKKVKNVVLLGFASFFNDMGSEIIMPILPLFIVALGGNAFIVGLIAGLRDILANVLKVFFGYLADKTGKRKFFVVSGYFNSSIFKLLLAFSRIWPHILLTTSFERIGKAMREAPRDAIISFSKERGKSFGIHRTLDTLGAIIGSILAFSFFYFLAFSFNKIIFIAAIISFISLIPLLFVKDKVNNKKHTFSFKIKNLSRNMKYFIIVAFIFNLANFSYMFFILKARNILTNFISATALTLLLYVIFNIFYSTFAIPFGLLSDKIGRKKVLLIGYFLFSLVCIGFVFSTSFVSLLLLFIFYGIVYSIIDSNQRAYISDLSTKKVRASSLGLFHTTTGIAMFLASIIAGLLWKISSNFVFIYGALLSFISVVVFILLIPNRKIFKKTS